jgi:predicted nucleic acid-binding protein
LASSSTQNEGTPVDLRDTLIAGIAQASGATLPTRNQRYFGGLAMAVINPFDN